MCNAGAPDERTPPVPARTAEALSTTTLPPADTTAALSTTANDGRGCGYGGGRSGGGDGDGDGGRGDDGGCGAR